MTDPVHIGSPSKTAVNAERARIEANEATAEWDRRRYEDIARAPEPERKAPLLARIIAMRRDVYWEGWGQPIRCRWGEFSLRGRVLAFDLYCYEEAGLHLGLFFVSLFISLPFLTRWMDRCSGSLDNPGYGFSWRLFDGSGGDSAIHLHWRHKTKLVYMPWGWNKRRGDYRNEKLTHEGGWLPDWMFKPVREPSNGGDHMVRIEERAAPPLWRQTYPFKHLTARGQFQMTIATVTRERRHDTYRIFGVVTKRRVQDHIAISYGHEMGDEAGSYKGGTVGQHVAMQPGESPRNALQRHQANAKFR